MLKSVAEHSHLTHILAEEVEQEVEQEVELTQQIQHLTSTKSTYAEDLSTLKSIREKQSSKVEDLKQEIVRENQVLLSLQRDTLDLKNDLEKRECDRREKLKEDYFYGGKEDCQLERRSHSYLDSPMPNFSFSPVTGGRVRVSPSCQYLNIPDPSDPKYNLLVSSEYEHQYRRPPPPPPAFPPAPPHYWPQSDSQFSYSTNCLSFSTCEACGKPANFLCSACKKVHYCTPRCQVASFNYSRNSG